MAPDEIALSGAATAWDALLTVDLDGQLDADYASGRRASGPMLHFTNDACHRAGTMRTRIEARTFAILTVGLLVWAGCTGSGAPMVAPSDLSYEVNPAVFSLGCFGVDVPSRRGSSATYSVTPPLPSGLDLDPETGIISGTPEILASPSMYTVTVSNAAGSTTTTVTIVITPRQPLPRVRHTATLLADGTVLIAGGFSGGVLASAEIYDPGTGSFTLLPSEMTTPRENHTATLLPGGKVLIAGGDSWGFLSSAELYDPATGVFSPTGNMAEGRSNQSATLLPDGEVLLAGGWTVNSSSYLVTQASAEIYDPGTGSFTRVNDMTVARALHTATLLATGQVLIAGGVSYPNGWPAAEASAELYDPSSRTFIATGSMGASRDDHAATLLPDGQVLVTGGDEITLDLATTELYDPATGAFGWSGSLAEARTSHTATLLGDGRVLVAGGSHVADQDDLASAEVYDPSTGSFTSTGSMATARDGHTATLLLNGDVLIVGGWILNAEGYWAALSQPELYDPGAGTFSQP